MDNEIKNKSISKNAVLNILRKCCNILFPLIIYPYLTRTLGPEYLGKYSFSESILQYAILFSELGITTYAIREGARIRDNKEKIQKFSNEVFSIHLLSTIVTFVIYVGLIGIIPKLREHCVLLLIMSIDIIANTLSRDWINYVYEDFAYTTIRFIVFQSISVILIFFLVKQPSDYIKYTIIVVSAVSLGYFLSLLHTSKWVKVGVTKSINLKKHFKPSVVLFVNSFAQYIYVSADLIMLGFFRSDEEVGIYTLSSKIYAIIKAVLIAVITVTIPRISKYLAEEKVDEKNNLLDILKDTLITLVFPCAAGLFMIGDAVIVLIGGSAYARGGLSLKILCAALALSVLGTFYGQAYLITHRKESQLLISTSISAISNVVLNILFIPLWGVIGAAITTLLSELINFLLCRRYSSKDSQKLPDSALAVLVGTITIMLTCFGVEFIIPSKTVGLIVAIGLSIILYGGTEILFHNRIIYHYIDKFMERK